MKGICLQPHRRRGNVIVLVALMGTVILGMAAFAVDLGSVVAAKREIQTSADTTAMSMASFIANQSGYESRMTICNDAVAYATGFLPTNLVLNNTPVPQLPEGIQTGKVIWDFDTGMYTDFIPNTSCNGSPYFNGVRVRTNLPVGLPSIFGTVLGSNSYNVSAEAIAMLPPRDYAIAYDKSGSMNEDSTLGHLHFMVDLRHNGDLTAQLNLKKVWHALSLCRPFVTHPPTPEGIFNPNYHPDAPTASGSKFGTFMNLASISNNGYGTSDFDMANGNGSYRPANDPGLVYLPASTWDDATLIKLGALNSTTLQPTGLWKQRDGVTQLTKDQILAVANRGSPPPNPLNNWSRRVGVALGLYHWTPVPGSDKTIGDFGSGSSWGELSMPTYASGESKKEVPYSSDYTFKWSQWFSYQGSSSSNYVGGAYDDFCNYFGSKTLVNYILTDLSGVSATPQLYAVPGQPDRAVKDAIEGFFTELRAINNNDYVSLTMFSILSGSHYWAEHAMDLRSKIYYQEGANEIMDKLNMYQPEAYTATGNAIQNSREYLLNNTHSLDETNGENPRSNAEKIIVLLTDGNANCLASGDCSDSYVSSAFTYAVQQADIAKQNKITIHSFTIGARGNWDLDCTQDSDSARLHTYYSGVSDGHGAGCGVGQAVAYITGGTATRIVGNFATIRSQILTVLTAEVAPLRGVPQLISISPVSR